MGASADLGLPAFGGRRRLRLEFGLVSAQGRRSSNQDYIAFCAGAKGDKRGSVAVVADGLGGHKGGREAAETTVRAFIDGYFGAADRLSPEQAAFRALESVNGWVAAQGRCDPNLLAMATTFTAILFIGGAAHVLHVGDSRAYRFVASRLEQLTVDHLVDTGAMALALQRAIGFEPWVCIDHAALDLAPHDRFLLCSDGLHGVLSPARIAKILRVAGAPQQAASALKNAALEAGGGDNVSVLVIDVRDTPPPSREALSGRLDAIMAQAQGLAPDPRPEDAFEFALELERPTPTLPRGKPFYQRNPRLFWQMMSLVLLIALIVSLAWR